MLRMVQFSLGPITIQGNGYLIMNMKNYLWRIYREALLSAQFSSISIHFKENVATLCWRPFSLRFSPSQKSWICHWLLFRKLCLLRRFCLKHKWENESVIGLCDTDKESARYPDFETEDKHVQKSPTKEPMSSKRMRGPTKDFRQFRLFGDVKEFATSNTTEFHSRKDHEI